MEALQSDLTRPRCPTHVPQSCGRPCVTFTVNMRKQEVGPLAAWYVAPYWDGVQHAASSLRVTGTAELPDRAGTGLTEGRSHAHQVIQSCVQAFSCVSIKIPSADIPP